MREIRTVLLRLLLANLAVVAAKLVVGVGTGSLAVLGDAVHASVDALNNVLGIAIVTVATPEPDEDHPYGHGKFETLGALGIVMFLSVTGFELAKGAVVRLLDPQPALDVGASDLALLLGTLAINAAVASYEARRGRELASDILLADAAHTRADVFIALGVLAGVGLARAGYTQADPIVALLVCGVIVKLVWEIVRRTVPVLVDAHAAPSDDIRRAALSVAGVREVYAIRSRRTQERGFAELTIAVDGAASVVDAHDVADAVESRIRDTLGIEEVTVHVEPG